MRAHAIMDHLMGGGMMWGMGLLDLLGIIVLILAAAALVKYLFFNNSRYRPKIRGSVDPLSLRCAGRNSHLIDFAIARGMPTVPACTAHSWPDAQ
jgi:hypothetical protein